MSSGHHLLSEQLEDEEEEDTPLPFERIETAAVLQRCRSFNDLSINVHDSMITMVEVLYLLSRGVELTSFQATDVFFAATKLFQNDDPKMRRLLFVLLKELAPFADQVFMASSSLMRDITNTANDINRCNAIRTLRKVIDTSTVTAVERYLKEAVVDRNSNVSCAALMTGIHLAHSHPDVVKHWGVKVDEALHNRGSKMQYHALALLHKLRRSDRLSVLKLVQQTQNGPIRSPLALCLLARLCRDILQDDFGNNIDVYKFLTTSLLHHTSDLVVIEAAHAICALRNVTAKEVLPAVMAVGSFLSSHKPTLRYTTIRILSKVAAVHPAAVQTITSDIETLVTDPNRSIATLAITTLLKIGNEFSIDRLLRHLCGPLLKELTDDSRIVITDSMRVLSAKYPSKYPILLDFLFNALRIEGGGDFKNAVIETMECVSASNPAAREMVLSMLAKFIEDCDYIQILKRVLCLIGEQGPATANPQQFIRYICNHIALESPLIRAVAVTTLAKFGAAVPDLRKSIGLLLKRVTSDPDDTVRDRAVFYYKLFSTGDEVAIRTLITEVTASVATERATLLPKPEALREAEEVQGGAAAAAAGGGGGEDGAAAAAGGGAAGGPSGAAAPSGGRPAGGAGAAGAPTAVALGLREKLRRIPQLRELGEPVRTTEPTFLTEQDNDYVVSVAKHVYNTNLVLQFKIHNTIEGGSLINFNVLADTEEVEQATPLYAIPVESIPTGDTAFAYLVLEFPEGTYPSGMVRCGCSFAMKEGDDEPGDVEEFPMDEFAINVCDYITPLSLGGSSGFETQWTALQAEETVDTYNLRTMKTLIQAAHAVIDFFGMYVEGGRPEKITSKSTVINMSGVMASSAKTLILISAKVFVASDNSVALQLALRGGDADLRQFLSTALVS